jgi:hypothetical protein
MQSTGHFRVEEQCRSDIEKQKQHMRDLVKDAGQKIEIMEGTCVDVDVKVIKGQPA